MRSGGRGLAFMCSIDRWLSGERLRRSGDSKRPPESHCMLLYQLYRDLRNAIYVVTVIRCHSSCSCGNIELMRRASPHMYQSSTRYMLCSSDKWEARMLALCSVVAMHYPRNYILVHIQSNQDMSATYLPSVHSLNQRLFLESPDSNPTFRSSASFQRTCDMKGVMALSTRSTGTSP
jgi:hypothetical protein